MQIRKDIKCYISMPPCLYFSNIENINPSQKSAPWFLQEDKGVMIGKGHKRKLLRCCKYSVHWQDHIWDDTCICMIMVCIVFCVKNQEKWKLFSFCMFYHIKLNSCKLKILKIVFNKPTFCKKHSRFSVEVSFPLSAVLQQLYLGLGCSV